MIQPQQLVPPKTRWEAQVLEHLLKSDQLNAPWAEIAGTQLQKCHEMPMCTMMLWRGWNQQSVVPADAGVYQCTFFNHPQGERRHHPGLFNVRSPVRRKYFCGLRDGGLQKLDERLPWLPADIRGMDVGMRFDFEKQSQNSLCGLNKKDTMASLDVV